MPESDGPPAADSGRLRELTAMAQHARRRYSLSKPRIFGSRASKPRRFKPLRSKSGDSDG